MEKGFNGFYEDEESLKMIDVINRNADIEYKKNLAFVKKEKRKQKGIDGLCLIGSIMLFAIIISWGIKLNNKLNQQDMNSCLRNNTQEYCEKNSGWGVK